MNITHVIESGGGSADFVLYLVKYLPQHQHNIIYGERTFGDRFTTVQQNYTNAMFYRWQHVQREISLFKDIQSAICLFKLLKLMRSDVIHVHSSKAGFLGRAICFLLRKKNVIYTPNGLSFIRTDISSLKAKIFLVLERTANWLCGKIICCSKSEAEELARRGIDCIYISNGTEVFEYFKNDEASNITQFVIASTGRLTIQKNPLLFNEIAKQFESDPKYRFIWIGAGELEHLLTSTNITITGWLDKCSVNKTLLETDLYISTASWEGLPFAVLEAMNLNKPLLLSDCVGNRDLVITNYNGFLYTTVEQAVNAIHSINNRKELLEEYGKNSFKLLTKKFNVESMAREYENEYKNLISKY